jgi:uracil-DNA glycosylase family 4
VIEPDSWDKLCSDIVTCRRCPRLVGWREEVARVKRRAYRDYEYWGRPVPSLGTPDARLLLVGLAPAAHGANRTGRMFSGDESGRTLIPALYRAGFANRPISEGPGDGLALQGTYITAVCHCAPPGNRPTPAEMRNCRPFLARELALLSKVRVVLALGRIGFEGYLQALREQGIAVGRPAFGHGGVYPLGDGLPTLVATYHPSRQNTNTGRLTDAMLDQVLGKVRELLGGGVIREE